ncbi:MAG: type II toxin-antitoxin system RelE/ParE family toxin [Alphaproteobacteria bacterium]
MAQILKRPLAEADLLEIWRHIALDNPKNADLLLDTIEMSIRTLLRSPLMGRERPELMAGLRSFVCKRYVIFYLSLENNIELIRVLHGSRDIDFIFQDT